MQNMRGLLELAFECAEEQATSRRKTLSTQEHKGANESEQAREPAMTERGTHPSLLRMYIPLATTIEKRWRCPLGC